MYPDSSTITNTVRSEITNRKYRTRAKYIIIPIYYQLYQNRLLNYKLIIIFNQVDLPEDSRISRNFNCQKLYIIKLPLKY